MSQENVEVVRAQFAATNERDFPRAMALYTDDVELVVQPAAFLDSGTFTGREAVGGWFANWFSTFEPSTRFATARSLAPSSMRASATRSRPRGSDARC